MRRPARVSIKKLTYLKWVIFLGVVFFGLFAAFQLKSSLFLSRQWRVNIAFHTTPLTIVSISPHKSDPLLVITLPESVYANVPWGYGSYRLGVVWKLGEQEKNQDLFVHTLEDTIGIKLHAVVGESQSVELGENPDQLYSHIKNAFPLHQILFNKSLTSLNFLDRCLLALQFIVRRSNSVLTYAAHLNGYLFVDTKLPDGSKVKRINTEAFQTFLEQKFEENTIREESTSVTIKNTTETAGVGNKFSRIITNLGGKVLTIGNEKNDINTCQIEIKKEAEKSPLVAYLFQEYGCQKILSVSDGGTAVVIRVGTFFGKRWKVDDAILFAD